MDDINYKDLMLRLRKFYNYPQTINAEYKIMIKYAEEIINLWIERGMKEVGNPKNVYELLIQLDLRGY